VGASRDSPNEFSQSLFAGLPKRYDALAWLLSFGQDRRWRDAMVARIDPHDGDRILDVACGPCSVGRTMLRRASARVVGIDLSEDMLAAGLRTSRQHGLTDQLILVRGRGEALPFADDSFDALTFTYLLRYVADPAATVAELARVVRPGGRIASLEFAEPTAPWWRAAWRVYTGVGLPMLGFVLGGPAWFRVGRFLGPSISAHVREYPPAWLADAWRRAGIERVECRPMSLGGGLVMSGVIPAHP
jgi:demethylmenaquinone methyltransferase / 2-methoxy-6-polyprenyl-1,4-benzoquinol methylase